MDLSQIVLLLIAAFGGLLLLGWERHPWRSSRQNRLTALPDTDSPATPRERIRAESRHIRLYNDDDIEARIEDRLSLLDELIQEADQEISRLEDLLAESRREWPSHQPLSLTEQQQCFALLEAGYSIKEIADRLKTTVHRVEQSLNEWQHPDRYAA